MVRDFLAALSPDLLDETRQNLWVPEDEEVVRSCLHTILEEEWEHLRFALRDLSVLENALGRVALVGGWCQACGHVGEGVQR